MAYTEVLRKVYPPDTEKERFVWDAWFYPIMLAIYAVVSYDFGTHTLDVQWWLGMFGFFVVVYIGLQWLFYWLANRRS